MRNPTDICLLCNSNLATKRNSHIYPKFLSTNFLGPKGRPRRGYDLSSDKILEGKPRIVQDSPKEDYILCEECEAYFGVLEGIASDTFINWQTKVNNGEFTLSSIIPELDIVECNTSDKKTIYLFIYSIFWRVSISSISLFENVKISDDFENDLREVLMHYRKDRQADYLTALNIAPKFQVFPTSIITSNSFTDETANILYAPFTYDPYSLVCDRFSFMLFKKEEDIKIDFIKAFSNINLDDCRMMIFSGELWHDTILDRPFKLLASQAKGKGQKRGS